MDILQAFLISNKGYNSKEYLNTPAFNCHMLKLPYTI
jgi:hypothetical protein